MSKLLGIDIRPSVVRVALLRTSYRRTALEALSEVDRAAHPDLGSALSSALTGLLHPGESVGVALEGSHVYLHTLSIPLAAVKQLQEVLPFEIEARVPVEFDTLVYDSRVLPRKAGAEDQRVLAVAAARDVVKERIALVREATGHEPESVTVGSLALGNLAQLAPQLRDEPLAVVIEIGERVSEVLILEQGAPVFARSLSVGVSSFPEGADALVRALRQTLLVWRSSGEPPVTCAYLCGGGAEVPGVESFLSEQLGLVVNPFPALDLEMSSAALPSDVPRYAKAIAIALGLRGGSKAVNLRQGDIAYQRGYGFLKERLPLLVGLAAALVVSFLFRAWAEGRALAHQNETLQVAVTELAQETFGEEVDGVERITELLESGTKEEKDPQPEVDAFDLALLLAAHIPKEMEHDVDELELQRGHVKLSGVVNSTEDAQKILEGLKKERCLKEVTISKISQQVKSSRQKYSMEFDLKCQDTKKKSSASEGEEG